MRRKKTTHKKAHIIAKRFTQKFGYGFDETFVSVGRLSTIRLLAALSAAMRVKLHEINVITAYLHRVTGYFL